MIEIKINNIDELITSLGKIDLKNALNIAIKKSVFMVERTAKINTPVDTGLLRNSYETYFGDLEGTLNNYREYAPYVEAKQLFLEKTMEQEVDNIQSIFENSISSLIANI